MAAAIIALVILVFAWHAANAYRLASAVLPPQASVRQRVDILFHKRNYQVAIPDRGIWDDVRFSIVPRARACGGGGSGQNCDSTGTKNVCPLNCPTGEC
jgi:hypothetical protein